MQRVPQANTTNHARALRQPLLYIEEIANHSLTAVLASKPGEQCSIIEQHKYDEAPYSCVRKPAMPVFKTAKQKRRQTVKSGAFRNMGWTMGIEPTTTGVTIPCSTN